MYTLVGNMEGQDGQRLMLVRDSWIRMAATLMSKKYVSSSRAKRDVE
jgi:hypothetical protein